MYITHTFRPNTYICTHLLLITIVKAVTSGDTVLLMSQKAPGNGLPAEESITLSSDGSKLGYGDTRPDELFAQSASFCGNCLLAKRSSSRLNIGPYQKSLGLSTSTAKCVRRLLNGWASAKSLEKSRDGVSEDFDERKLARRHARPNLHLGQQFPSQVPNRLPLDADALFQEGKTSHWLLWSSGTRRGLHAATYHRKM